LGYCGFVCLPENKEKTLYAMISDIPHYRVGKLIRFKKDEIDSWMQNKKEKTFDEITEATASKSKPPNKGNTPVDKMIRKAIDQSKQEVYNPAHGKSDRIEGLIKEKNNGSI
jgi:hypothetical protein